ncbi:MAG TPA: hypothetical protein VK541_00205 [Pedobacter sp.]|uniref:glycosyltransferase family 2 protein n=1 Tax=Pedobacter sp. TaxID=1411316 RepID=UPI002B9FACD7|nr:hypothetical protein [Pedobacter sp.]HMI00865.1 hypothetical protein [Pedobacter sp.]
MRHHLIRIVLFIYWKLINVVWFFLTQKKEQLILQSDYSIVVITYIDRFDTFFKPLIKKLRFCFPDTQLIVVVNGHFDVIRQNEYLINLNLFLKKYKNVKAIKFETPQSLSKLWNLGLLEAACERVMILNDDVNISPWFRSEINHSGILNERITLMNRSWSHFMISKDIVRRVGWFDERFPAIGNEDEDYEARLVFSGITLPTITFRQIQNIVEIPKSYSYGEHVELVNIKYVKANKEFFNSKWEISSNRKEGFKYVQILGAYLKLKNGMETPDFYDLNQI